MTEAQATQLLTRAGEIEALLYVSFFALLALVFLSVVRTFGGAS